MSARERPKEYEDEWAAVVDQLRSKWDSVTKLGDLMRDRLEESLMFSDKTKDPRSAKAKRVYQTMKEMRNDADISQDPFRKKFGEKVVEELIKEKELFSIFLHWAYRDNKESLPVEHWKMHGKEIDNFTNGYTGLDLTDKEIFEWIVENYGEDEDVERLRTKIDPAREYLYEVFSEQFDNKDWGELVESKRLMKAKGGTKKAWWAYLKEVIAELLEDEPESFTIREIWTIVQRRYPNRGDGVRFKAAPGGGGGYLDISPNKLGTQVGAIVKYNYPQYKLYGKKSHSTKYMLVKSDFNKADDEEKDPIFIQPNKPMYRIFEIDDMKELKGFTGEWVVQEKYDGLRIQLHKDKDMKVYSFNGKDITNKFDKQIQILEKDSFPDCILDAEAVLYKDDEPLHRADTLAYINSKDTKEGYDLKVHVFDIMKYDGESVLNDKLEERLQKLMNKYSGQSHDFLQFPNKRDTRFADSLEEIEEYAMEIMKNPTSEGVIIKDAKSSYVVGKKKNPKWIKWKKFVDLDLIVLDKRKNKNGTFSYTLGAGPLSEEDKEKYRNKKEIGDKVYLNVGKALNTKITVDNIGQIIRVKVDEVKKTKTGFSIYSAKVIEIPEVKEAERVETLEFLSKDSKKSASDYTIEVFKKSYIITDNIHGIAKLHTEIDMDGFILTGMDNTLMGKNAIHDIEIWKDELRDAYGKDSGILFSTISDLVHDNPKTISEIVYHLKGKQSDIIRRLFGSAKDEKDLEGKILSRIREQGEAYGIEYDSSNNKFSWDGSTINKPDPDIETDNLMMSKADYTKGTYELWRRKDEDLNLAIELEDRKLIWRIKQENVDDIFSLFGKADKFEAQVDKTLDRFKMLDSGKIKLGSQRDGYHEYFLSGDLHDGKMHFRIVPIDNKDTWVTWTGYEQTPTDEESDKGVWDIDVDKYKDVKYTD